MTFRSKSDWNWGKIYSWLGILFVVGAAIGYYGWYKFFREEPQEAWINATPETRFRYGSIGGERDAGIPYWIFYVLPRIFPEKLPGPGGYASLGVSWEQGKELPIGFTKKTVGFARVGNNCSVCHTTNYRVTADSNPVFIDAGPGHTLNLEAFFRFLVECAKDPRFNADILMREINSVTDLSWDDALAYRFLIIPMTKKQLVERETQFAWIFRKDFPDWGRGRDDSMNLTKYFMLELPMDDTFGPGDIPSIWNLKKYNVPGTTMNWSGDSHDAYSVIIDSALGVLGAPPKDNEEFLGHIRWLQEYLSNTPPPKYPFPIDASKAEAGRAIFDAQCASCHASDKTGRRMALAGIDTDRGRMDTWNKDNAIAANKVVAEMGIERKGLVEAALEGYNPPFLDGVWARGPYLHHGAVPTLRDLLEPVANRPKVFWRGYDLYDQTNVGFISQGPEAERVGTKYDTSALANDNGGHLFGTQLPAADKDSLIEYLKTL